MSSGIYCERCDSYVTAELRDLHEQACVPGYDPYNSADRYEHSRVKPHTEHVANLSMFLRRQAG